MLLVQEYYLMVEFVTLVSINLSKTPGLTKKGGGVQRFGVEFKTGQTRTWYKCHDHFNKVNRIHPKSINGQIVSAQHYPLTKAEL